MKSSIEVAREIRNAISNGVTEKFTAAQIDEVRKPLVEALQSLLREDGHYIDCPAPNQKTHDFMPKCEAVQHCKRIQSALAQCKP